MVSTPQSRPSSTRQSVEEFLEALAGPLLDRCRAGQPALGLAYYEGQGLVPRWRKALQEWGRERGVFVEHVLLEELGESPVRRLLQRRRVGEHLFSLEIRPAQLPDPALGQPTTVADLNIHRDTLRDERFCILLWVPKERARRFLELASNLADYHTVDLDVPAFPEEGEPAAELRRQTPAAGPQHNLPLESIGGQFMGREAEMARLREMLRSSGRSAITDPLALEGLGGIGKTRLALEYAWRHLGDYDRIYFLLADTPQALRAGLAGLAEKESLALPEAAETSEEVRARAVLRWFGEHDRWLLVLDGADSEETAEAIARDVLPGLRRGHVLLTTRFRRWGGQVQAVPLDALPESEAVRYLIAATEGLRRTTADDAEAAAELARTVDGLPLALEQIAAWTRFRHCSFAEALAAITRDEDALLRWYDLRELRYPLPVAAVWERSLERLGPTEQLLLRCLAWLAPAPVPNFMLRVLRGVCRKEIEGPANFVVLARQLADKSLLTARADHSFQLHRLWLELERRRTPAPEHPLWDARVAETLHSVAPDGADDVRNWPRLSLLEPHALELFRRTESLSPESLATADEGRLALRLSDLLNRFGAFLWGKAELPEAEPLMRRALAIDEMFLGPDHPNVARDLNDLGVLLRETNRLAEAEPLLRRALAIDEMSLGPDHPSVAVRLNNLAALLGETNRFSEAEPLYRRALAIDEAFFCPDHPSIGRDLNDLGVLLRDTGRLTEAEPFMRRALTIYEKSLGPDHPRVATALNNLAQLLQATNRFSEAEPLMRQALAIDEASFGPDHPSVATGLNNLALLLQDTNRVFEVEPLYRRALAIDEASFGPDHPDVAKVLNNLAAFLKDTNRLSEAEPLVRRALAIDEASFGPDHPAVATDLNNLAALLQTTNRLSEAEPLMRRALMILRKFRESTGHEHPHFQAAIGNYAALLVAMDLPEEEVKRRVQEAAG